MEKLDNGFIIEKEMIKYIPFSILINGSNGEVKNSEIMGFVNEKPIADGLFCERIFGPIKNFECSCGRSKRLSRSEKRCDRCGVDIVESKVRRTRYGHIKLPFKIINPIFLMPISRFVLDLLKIPSVCLDELISHDMYLHIFEDGKHEFIPKYNYLIRIREKSLKKDSCLTGFQAIEHLIKKIDNKDDINIIKKSLINDKSLFLLDLLVDNKLSLEEIFIDTLLVIPPDIRNFGTNEPKKWYCHKGSKDYEKSLFSFTNDFYRKIIQMIKQHYRDVQYNYSSYYTEKFEKALSNTINNYYTICLETIGKELYEDGKYVLSFNDIEKNNDILSVLRCLGIEISGLEKYNKEIEMRKVDKPLIEIINNAIYFGNYYINNNRIKEPIKWIVLERKQGKALVVSDQILEEMEFMNELDFDMLKYDDFDLEDDCCYEKSLIRDWLNTVFYKQAFNEKEREYIIVPQSNLLDEDKTSDRIFLLSKYEVEEYLNSYDSRRVTATNYISDKNPFYPFDIKLNEFCNWWLRSFSNDSFYALSVEENGLIIRDSIKKRNGIRPALWIKLD